MRKTCKAVFNHRFLNHFIQNSVKTTNPNTVKSKKTNPYASPMNYQPPLEIINEIYGDVSKDSSPEVLMEGKPTPTASKTKSIDENRNDTINYDDSSHKMKKYLKNNFSSKKSKSTNLNSGSELSESKKHHMSNDSKNLYNNNNNPQTNIKNSNNKENLKISKIFSFGDSETFPNSGKSSYMHALKYKIYEIVAEKDLLSSNESKNCVVY